MLTDKLVVAALEKVNTKVGAIENASAYARKENQQERVNEALAAVEALKAALKAL